MKRAMTGVVVVLCVAIFQPVAAGEPSKLALQRAAVRKMAQSLRIQSLGLRYLVLGKDALIAKNVPGAHAWFLLARPRLVLQQQQAEANFYVAVTRLLLLPMQEQPIAARLGFQGPGKTPLRQDHLNPLAFTAVPPRQVSLPAELARGSDWQELLASDALPALEESLAELRVMANIEDIHFELRLEDETRMVADGKIRMLNRSGNSIIESMSFGSAAVLFMANYLSTPGTAE